IAAAYLQDAGRSSVDLLVLTHFHADHANGVERLMNRTDVKYLAIATDCEENSYTDDILAVCEANGTEVLYITENTEIMLDGLVMTLYAPLGSEDPNEHCLLIRGDFGDFEFLVTGDAGSGVEKLLTGFYELGDMELLVVGHHGSKYSTSERLLDDITPEYAYISVGAGNSYGHPTSEVLGRLDARDIEVYRTDLDGTISMTVGKEYG
ncbi:MAG: MBL fold metallo-hydrolase, partial [Clostridia bacterium]|nr:MBL fold metallo-hydrolase [Clostridia bacterium]